MAEEEGTQTIDQGAPTGPESEPFDAAREGFMETDDAPAGGEPAGTSGEGGDEPTGADELPTGTPAGDEPADDLGEGPEAEPEGEPDDVDVEAGEDEGEPEGDTEFATVEVDLPESFHDQGIEGLDFDVPEEQAEPVQRALNALVTGYEDRTTREEQEQALVKRERELEHELDEFTDLVEREPFTVVEAVFGNEESPEVVDRLFIHWLAQDDGRFSRVASMLDEVRADEGELNRVRREAELDLRERRTQARERADLRKEATERSNQIRSKLTTTLEKIHPDQRTFVQQRLANDIRMAIREFRAEHGHERIDPSFVDRLARPYLERFKAVEEAPEGEDADSEAAARAKDAQERFQKRVRLRRRAAKSKGSESGGTPSKKAKGPKRGATLDEVLDDMKDGGLPI